MIFFSNRVRSFLIRYFDLELKNRSFCQFHLECISSFVVLTPSIINLIMKKKTIVFTCACSNKMFDGPYHVL